MKFKLIIDKTKEEEVAVTAHERSSLTEQIEALVMQHTGSDRIIAYTSQLAHIVSSAYVKSPEAQRRRGFSAGSFRDMTRVARLDEDMWTELMLSDADYLVKELGILIENLTAYKTALEEENEQQLHDLLKAGREAKASAGGN